MMTKEEAEKLVNDVIDSDSPKNRYSDSPKKLIVDPPSGWKYGFPKQYFKNKISSKKELNDWLVEEGYPNSIIESFGDAFPVRFWHKKE
jgi:hypothetical protein